jgi:hypothetical protein
MSINPLEFRFVWIHGGLFLNKSKKYAISVKNVPGTFFKHSI